MVGIAVDLVHPPHAFFGRVHTGDHHTVPRQILVPFTLLAVFDQEELVGVRGIEAVALVALVERRQGDFGARVDDHGGCKPQGITLIQAISHRIAPEVAATAARHDGPFTGVAALAATAAVVGVIQVGQSQHMTKLMAEGADAVHIAPVAFPSGYLGRASIQAEVDTIVGWRFVKVEHVRPQVVLVVAAVVGREACHEKEDHIYFSVPIGVIVVEVNCGIDGIEGGIKDGVGVACPARICAGVIDGDRSHDIKLRVKHVSRIVIEIIPDAASHVHMAAIQGVSCIVVGVDHVIIEVGGRGIVHREFLVVVIDEDDQSTELFVIEKAVGTHTAYGTVAGSHPALSALQ